MVVAMLIFLEVIVMLHTVTLTMEKAQSKSVKAQY